MARNVKDTCVSYYHHSLLLSGHTGSFNDYCSLFREGFGKKNKLNYQIEHNIIIICLVVDGNYVSHVKSYWKHRNESNLIFINYESMQKNLPNIIEKISAFINKPLLITDPRMETLVHNLSFENMKIDTKASRRGHIDLHKKLYGSPIKGDFMRKGIVGSHKEEMSENNIKMINKWIEEEVEEGELKNILMSDNETNKYNKNNIFH